MVVIAKREFCFCFFFGGGGFLERVLGRQEKSFLQCVFMRGRSTRVFIRLYQHIEVSRHLIT